MFAVLNKSSRLSESVVNKFEEVLINIRAFADEFCSCTRTKKKTPTKKSRLLAKELTDCVTVHNSKGQGLKPNGTAHADDVILRIQEEATLPVGEVLTGCLCGIEVRYNSGKPGQEEGV